MAIKNLTSGNDAYTIATSPETVYGLAGNDTIWGNTGADVIYGGFGNDSVVGALGDDTLYGGAGNDTITGWTGLDQLYGGDGNDILQVGAGDLADGGLGIDIAQMDLTEITAAVTLTLGADVWAKVAGANSVHLLGIERLDLALGAGSDTVTGGALDDTIRGGGGFDHIFAGAGNDVVEVNGLAFEAHGGAGADVLVLNYGATTGATVVVDMPLNSFRINGTAQVVDGFESLQFRGNSVNLTLTGSALADRVDIFGGSLIADAGAGNDTLTMHDTPSITAHAELQGGNGDDFLWLDGTTGFAHGGAGNDRLQSSDSGEVHTLYGDAGDDNISADGHGGGSAYGGSGNDTIIGQYHGGAQVFDGGLGNDTLVLRWAADATPVVWKSAVTAQGVEITKAGVVTRFAGFEAYAFTSDQLDDSLTGGAGNDTLVGDALFEYVSLDGGKDTLTGGAGDDNLLGLGGADVLFGGDGNDTLTGGNGADTLTGGAGADTFKFSYWQASAMGNSTRDLILDFTDGLDRIDLSDVGRYPYGQGDESTFTFIGSGVFTGHAWELRTFQSGGFTYLRADVNGDMVADLSIQIKGLHVITATDISL